ncbi:MAG: outer membrane lipoprotein carrier protein LolA [Proteobacteria bacterium]|nr:MAG: outer membrane lipoprotein carrier protein LolA [Pseudomonadota bacterium]
MESKIVGLIAAACLALATPASFADARDKLDRFFVRVQTFAADFEQVVLDEQLNRVEESTGRMWIARPGRFRWDYDPPLEQQIVSDGERVWVYDIELEQVTVRRLGDALGRTPAILLAGSGDLEDNYRIEDRGLHGQVEWVALIPRDSDGNFSEIQLGFEGDSLRLLQLADQIGQITRIVFSDNEVNPGLAPTLFDFAPPPGVDVIDDSF